MGICPGPTSSTTFDGASPVRIACIRSHFTRAPCGAYRLSHRSGPMQGREAGRPILAASPAVVAQSEVSGPVRLVSRQCIDALVLSRVQGYAARNSARFFCPFMCSETSPTSPALSQSEFERCALTARARWTSHALDCNANWCRHRYASWNRVSERCGLQG